MIDTLVKNYNLITKHTIRENNKKEGIEIYFTSIPSGLERQTLKDNNWRWSSFNKCWYIKKSELGLEVKETKKQTKKTTKESADDIELIVEDKKTTNKVASDKQVLATVKKILKYSEKVRPVLSAYTPYDDKVLFTDSFRLCILNRESLPFNVAFTEDYKNEKEYMKKYGSEETQKIEGKYPSLKNIFPKEDAEDTITFNVDEVKEKAKASGKKNKESRMIELKSAKGVKVIFDSEYLKDMVTLLQIKDKNVTMNCYGDNKPSTYENENGYYLALPIRKY